MTTPFIRRPKLEIKSQEFEFSKPTLQANYLSIPDVCNDVKISPGELEDEGEIGSGSYGFVSKMYHKPTNHKMAVKRIRSIADSAQAATLRDLEVVKSSSKCGYIVRFYGAMFQEGDCWICMELMDGSADDFYKIVYRILNKRIEEDVLSKFAVATVSALNYLKNEQKIIHRDIKPSNILIKRDGSIKLCDFGISGKLIDSIALTRDAGCKPYMAPERINPKFSCEGYDIRSDVWSFGITITELALGRFPYPIWQSIFQQLSTVVNGDPPRLNSLDDPKRDPKEPAFSPEFCEFVHSCLTKEVNERPKYDSLMTKPFFITAKQKKVNVAGFFLETIAKVPQGMTLHNYVVSVLGTGDEVEFND